MPIVTTGFEPLDILQGVAMCVEQLETGRAELLQCALNARTLQKTGATRDVVAACEELAP